MLERGMVAQIRKRDTSVRDLESRLKGWNSLFVEK